MNCYISLAPLEAAYMFLSSPIWNMLNVLNIPMPEYCVFENANGPCIEHHYNNYDFIKITYDKRLLIKINDCEIRISFSTTATIDYTFPLQPKTKKLITASSIYTVIGDNVISEYNDKNTEQWLDVLKIFTECENRINKLINTKIDT